MIASLHIIINGVNTETGNMVVPKESMSLMFSTEHSVQSDIEMHLTETVTTAWNILLVIIWLSKGCRIVGLQD